MDEKHMFYIEEKMLKMLELPDNLTPVVLKEDVEDDYQAAVQKETCTFAMMFARDKEFI